MSKKDRQGTLFNNLPQKKKRKKSKECFFEKPFDAATLLKLELFQSYLKSWLPTFFHYQTVDTINIFDLFCGPGLDCDGVKGSPLRTIDVVKTFKNIIPEGLRIKAFFNDENKESVELLKEHISNQDFGIPNLTLHISSSKFKDEFGKLLPLMRSKKTANFLFLDPFGLALEKSVFEEIKKTNKTDFLLFAPFQKIHQFCETNEFQRFFPKLDRSRILVSSNAHRDICEYMKKEWVPNDDFYLKPFALQKEKNPNKYGLIFGSGHLLGLYKFIELCWKLDPQNGEANFSMIGDLPSSDQGLLIEEYSESKKVRNFIEMIEKKILEKAIQTNRDLFEESLDQGFFPTQHPKSVLRNMKKKKMITNKLNKFPLSYKPVISEKKIVEIELAR